MTDNGWNVELCSKLIDALFRDGKHGYSHVPPVRGDTALLLVPPAVTLVVTLGFE